MLATAPKTITIETLNALPHDERGQLMNHFYRGTITTGDPLVDYLFVETREINDQALAQLRAAHAWLATKKGQYLAHLKFELPVSKGFVPSTPAVLSVFELTGELYTNLTGGYPDMRVYTDGVMTFRINHREWGGDCEVTAGSQRVTDIDRVVLYQLSQNGHTSRHSTVNNQYWCVGSTCNVREFVHSIQDNKYGYNFILALQGKL